MKALQKHLIPILHVIKTSPYNLLEFLLTPIHIKTQEKDWKKLSDKYVQLSLFFENRNSISNNFKTAYWDYVTNYSSPLISMSLTRGTFFYYFCQTIKPKSILDLGSGFSTYIFGKYAETATEVNITSIDDSEYWIKETEEFLLKYNVTGCKLETWKTFSQSNHNTYDLIFLDIKDLDFRLSILPDLVEMVKKGALLLIDDFHVPWYRWKIKKICQENQIEFYSLRKVTRTRLSHNALIMGNPPI